MEDEAAVGARGDDEIDHDAEGMERREHAQDAVVQRHVDVLHGVFGVVQQISMGERDGLRQVFGAGGEEDDGRVLHGGVAERRPVELAGQQAADLRAAR